MCLKSWCIALLSLTLSTPVSVDTTTPTPPAPPETLQLGFFYYGEMIETKRPFFYFYLYLILFFFAFLKRECGDEESVL